MELGKRITEIRKENNMTQEELAEKFHVTRQTISNWENGKSYPDIETLVHISNEFNVSLDMLMKGDKDMVSKITKEQRQGRKQKRRIIITIAIVVAYMCGAICVLNNFDTERVQNDYGIAVNEPIKEPIFVKSLVSSTDTNIDIEYITNNEFKLTPVDVGIPNMPDELYLDFYAENVDTYQGYSLHCLSFGIGSNDLNKSGGLNEPFTFEEIVVKWDDGSKTKANIGTINVTNIEEETSFNNMSSELLNPSAKNVMAKESFNATENLSITDIEIPYSDELSGLISEMKLDGKDVSKITEQNPFIVEKGKDYILKYTIDSTSMVGFGKIFLEGQIIGTNEVGEQVINTFIVQDLGKVLPEWVYEQIKNAEQ